MTSVYTTPFPKSKQTPRAILYFDVRTCSQVYMKRVPHVLRPEGEGELRGSNDVPTIPCLVMKPKRIFETARYQACHAS